MCESTTVFQYKISTAPTRSVRTIVFWGLIVVAIMAEALEALSKDPVGGVQCLFCDIDGTLVHYFENEAEIPGLPEAIPLPASSSGRRGYISVKALRLAARVRSTGTRLVLVSGTRYSTFAGRLPYLPRADAYVIENGGRIFFPRKRLSESVGAGGGGGGVEVGLPDELASVIGDPELTAHPASALEEDLEWRKVMESVTGPAAQDSKNPDERKGALWDLYREVVAEAFEVDTNTYYTMFRIKAKDHNDKKRIEEDKDDGDERDKVPGGQNSMKRLLGSLPPGLRVATNLGLVDIFSERSGKHNAAAYLAKEHFKISLDRCASMGDDDNDIALANTMGKGAFLTGFTSESVEAAAKADPQRFKVAKEAGVRSSEEMLRLILELCT